MPTRLGIEVGPVACRLVALDAGPAIGLPGRETWVRAFSVCASRRPDVVESLRAFRGERAAVVVWGVAADHGQSVVARGGYREMRRDALRQRANPAGDDVARVLADIAPVGPSPRGVSTRHVVLASAHREGIGAALQVLDRAGIRTRSVLTPAAALMSIARLRRGPEAAGALQAYVALSETGTAIALIRDRALVSAHEVPWGFLDPDRQFAPRETDEIVATLAGHLAAYFKTARAAHGAVSTVLVCGGAPRLRTMAALLIEPLDLEVEPLDSLFAIDVARLPANGADLRERSAEMRLAWAAAADWPAPLDLLRQQRQRERSGWVAGAAMVAGMATGLAVGLGIETAVSRVSPAPHPAALVQAGRAPREARPRGTVIQAAPPAVETRPPADPPLTAADFVRSSEPLSDAGPAASAQAPVDAAPAPRAVREAPVSAPQPPVRPFKAEVRTILYAPERKLAFIDGQIVEPGDLIHGARVVDITPTTVIVEDRTGARTELRIGDARP